MKFVRISSTGPMCVVTLIKSMKHKYELLLNGRKMSEKCCTVNNVLPDRYVSIFIVVISIPVLMNLKLYFEMFSFFVPF
jgi:hypothetical protein